MISLPLLGTCLLWGGVALFVFDLAWYFLEKKLDLTAKLPPELMEPYGPGYFISKYMTGFSFLVVLPSVLYSWAYVLVPFYGLRAGIVLALYLFVLGIIPFSVILLMRIKIPLAYTLFQMAGYLVRLLVIYGIIASLYVL